MPWYCREQRCFRKTTGVVTYGLHYNRGRGGICEKKDTVGDSIVERRIIRGLYALGMKETWFRTEDLNQFCRVKMDVSLMFQWKCSRNLLSIIFASCGQHLRYFWGLNLTLVRRGFPGIRFEKLRCVDGLLSFRKMRRSYGRRKVPHNAYFTMRVCNGK